AHGFAFRRFHRAIGFEAGVAGDRCQRLAVGDIALLGPDDAHQPPGETVRVAAEPLHGKQSAVRRPGVDREELRLQVQGRIAKLPPALQLVQAVVLALDRTLRQRQTARNLEYRAEVDRFVTDPDPCSARHRHEGVVAQVRPGRTHRVVVVDLFVAHAPLPFFASVLSRWTSRSRRSLRRVLPVVVIGSSGTNSTIRGYSCAASLVRTKSRTSCSSAVLGVTPSRRTMNALTISVRVGSGTPTAAARATAGCRIRHSSISPGPIRYPALVMRSSSRPTK